METNFLFFLDYGKYLDGVRRQLLFSILQDRNIPKDCLEQL